MKNFFAIVILLLLVVEGLLVSSAPQKTPSTSASKDRLNEVVKIISAFDDNPSTDPITLISELSPQCQGALLSIVTAPEFFQCVPVSALLPIVTDPALGQSLISDPIATLKKYQDLFLQASSSICEVPKCSDSGLEGALKAVQDGCSSESDLKNGIIKLATAAIAFYSPARDVICFQDEKNNFCYFGEDVDYLASLKPSPIVMVGGILDEVAASNTADVCTKCNKKIFNTALNYIQGQSTLVEAAKKVLNSTGINDEKLGFIKLGVALKCGVEFEDGKVDDPPISSSKSTGPTGRFGHPKPTLTSPTIIAPKPTSPTSKPTGPTITIDPPRPTSPTGRFGHPKPTPTSPTIITPKPTSPTSKPTGPTISIDPPKPTGPTKHPKPTPPEPTIITSKPQPPKIT